LGRTKAEINPDDYDRYKVKIQQLLKRENLTTEEIVDSFGSNRHEQVVKTMEFLLDEGLLEEVEGKLAWRG
jgi:ATP-dependent DNA helicase RecQ